MRAQPVRKDARLAVTTEHEQRERGGVPPDRRLRVGGALLERPARVGLRAVPVAGEDARLEDRDRPAPASRRRELIALPVTLDGPCEPLPRFLRIAAHEPGQTGAGGGVAHPRQLALAGVLILRVRQSGLAVPVAFVFTPCVPRPVHHGKSL